MYIIFDETIIDSEEIKDLIQQKSDFKVEKDMCKATKREDVLKLSDVVKRLLSETD